MTKTAPALAATGLGTFSEVNTVAATYRITLAVTALVVAALALAARMPFFSGSIYPLNDGGMFAQIVDELRAHHFALPHETSYNFEHIPLCYPPLGFYFGAIWSAVFHQSSMEMLRWVPLFFNLLSLPVFCLLAMEFLGEAFAAASATAIYAVLPRSSEWLTMGGGLTRSPGELFALLAIWLFVRGQKLNSNRLGALAGVFTGLAILSHLEGGTFCVASLLFLASAGKQVAGSGWRTNLRLLVIAGVVSALIIAPWFLWALKTYGATPFQAAFGTRGYDGTSGFGLKIGDVMPWLTLAAVMAALRQPPFILWVLVVDILVARSSATHTVIPIAIFGGWLVATAAFRLSEFGGAQFRRRSHALMGATAACLVLSALWTTNFLHHHLMPHDRISNLEWNQRATLVPSEVDAMHWVKTNTPVSARFVVFNQRSDVWAEDFVGEWFPYLAQRPSILTSQGREWLPHNAFGRTLKRFPKVNKTFTMADLQKLIGNDFDFVFVAGPFDDTHVNLQHLYETIPGFSRLVYQKGDIEIFTRR